MLLNAGINLALREEFAHLTFVCARSAIRILWWSAGGVRGWWSSLEICVIDVILVLLLLNLDIFRRLSIKYFIFQLTTFLLLILVYTQPAFAYSEPVVDVVLVSLLLALSMFRTYFYCSYCLTLSK